MSEITLVFVHTHSEDEYFEDEHSSQEWHTLRSTSTVKFIECADIPMARKAYREMCDANADNPPYDEYRFVMAYWTVTKQVINYRQLEENDDENIQHNQVQEG